jgi:16S rRNA A1518/A1519 N6-dimethyltransferase RsmA/KsgA/DIM1 with predicted DNA glycosylase/AP lyase activity
VNPEPPVESSLVDLESESWTGRQRQNVMSTCSTAFNSAQLTLDDCVESAELNWLDETGTL